jgi:hypothetical protein
MHCVNALAVNVEMFLAVLRIEANPLGVLRHCGCFLVQVKLALRLEPCKYATVPAVQAILKAFAAWLFDGYVACVDYTGLNGALAGLLVTPTVAVCGV